MSNIPTTKQYELKYITYKAFSVFDVRRWGAVSSRVARYGKQTSSRLVTYGKQTSDCLVTYGKETSGRLITYGGHLYRQTLDSLGSTVYQRVKGFWVSNNDEPCSRTDVEGTDAGCRCLLCRAQQSGHQLTVVRDVHGRCETNAGPSGSWIFVPNLAESGVETSHPIGSMDNTIVLNSESGKKYPKTIEGPGIRKQLAACSLSCPQSAVKCSTSSAVESSSRSEAEIFFPESTLRSAPENFSRSGREIFISDVTPRLVLESSFRPEAESFLPEGTLRSVPESTTQLEVKSTIQPAAENTSISSAKSITQSESINTPQFAMNKTLKSKTERIQQASAKNTRKSESVRNQESQTKRIKSETGSSQQTSTKRTFRQEAGSCPLCSAIRTLGSDEGSSLQSASKRPFIVEAGRSQQQITRSAAIEFLQSEAKSPPKRSPKPTKRASKSPLLKPRLKRAK